MVKGTSTQSFGAAVALAVWKLSQCWYVSVGLKSVREISPFGPAMSFFRLNWSVTGVLALFRILTVWLMVPPGWPLRSNDVGDEVMLNGSAALTFPITDEKRIPQKSTHRKRRIYAGQ